MACDFWTPSLLFLNTLSNFHRQNVGNSLLLPEIM